ncbi:MAG: hypothetical protein KatS3mg109_0580 [Pirellulaceae bacterium]|nr:MAG: hypothetical protein KatS3mg109_0580 [Pirellulaceae bacterium]
MISDNIPGVDNIRRFIPNFQPNGLGRWRIFHLECDDQTINLTILAEYTEEFFVEITMYGVRELRLPDIHGWCGFDTYVIEEIRSHQWEGIGYRIEECEEGRRFLCLCHSVAFTKLIIARPDGLSQVIWDASTTVPSGLNQ